MSEGISDPKKLPRRNLCPAERFHSSCVSGIITKYNYGYNGDTIRCSFTEILEREALHESETEYRERIDFATAKLLRFDLRSACPGVLFRYETAH